MYTVVCFFRVRKSDKNLFLRMTKKTGELLKSHGTLEHHIYQAHELTGRQGSMGMLNLIDIEEDEELLMGQTIFKSRDHYEDVMSEIGSDDIIQYLHDHIKDTVDMTRVITSSFATDTLQ
ncbi:DUF1428 family protein [Halobacillus yeomjeoni]|uniref:DUF1428 family protein n=1 Tax=Halobacillus yeomjeoni TaxID=311194 RepID=UPI001CD21FF2|nr:DUF1428 family protein [Halobacillus yeomjeoni]MCA0984144.1 DUF1428 family protein [Halobacillus yeomjeoni]